LKRREYNASLISGDFENLVYAERLISLGRFFVVYLLMCIFNLLLLCSCDAKSLAASNVTAKIVLCYALANAKVTPRRVAIPDVLNNAAMAGAKGPIFAQYTTNILDGLSGRVMPYVLVDFERAQRIRSYWEMAG
jgi:hypothetical protein